MTLLLAAWTGAGALFLLLGLLTPIDMRSYLAVAPALAILASIGVGGGLQRAWPVKLTVLMLAGWFAAGGLRYWIAWLSPVPPPR